MALKQIVDFLCAYIDKHEQPVGSEGRLPFRLLSHTIREEELRGECLDLALQHLKSNSCPRRLAFFITRKAVDEVLNNDLSEGLKQTESQEKVYDTTFVARLVFASIHTICQEWKGDPPLFLIPEQSYPQCSECGIRNVRRKMEDRHSVFTDLNTLLGLKNRPWMQWYAVYDGHGGLDASNYASKQLFLHFTKQDDVYSNTSEALKRSIQELDEKFCIKAKREVLRSGTTAVVAVIVEQMLHIAWVGDSQAMLVRDGKPLTLMTAHKPEREDEKQRIEELGGCVVWFGAWRVNGSLSVSRAIGDADHKPFVSGVADAASVTLNGSEDFLCLACDGFWDVFNGNDLVRLVREHIKETNNRDGLAEHLCNAAKMEGSTDNITVVVIFLREQLNLEEEKQSEDVDQTIPADKSEVEIAEDANSNSNNSNNSGEVGAEQNTDNLNMLQGLQLELGQKQKIPHKLLINYVKNAQKKKSMRNAVIVTESSSHAKLPRSLNNPRLESQYTSSSFRRIDTRGSLLSLSTIDSKAELTLGNSKKNLDRHSMDVLPSIHESARNKKNKRLSIVSMPRGADISGKPLGHRAPNMHTRGRTRLPFRASLVVTCQQGNSRSSSLNGNYVRSFPEHANGVSQEDNGADTEIAITNYFSSSLRPRHEIRARNNRQIVKLKYVGRQRSRSAV